MATLIVGAILAANPILGPAGFIISSLLMAGAGYIDMLLFAPKQPNQEGPKMDDLKIQTSTYGAFIPIVYGTTRIAGNIIWGTDYQEHKKEESAGGGGKGGGGGGGAKVITYTYSISFAVGLAQGPCNFVAGTSRVWADGKIFDMSTASYSFYEGTETQMPDSFTEGKLGAGNTPAYRGLCYIVFKDLDVTPMGNRIPSLSFELTSGKSALLSDIVSDISLEAGLVAGEFDTTDLADITVSGMTIAGDKTFRERIEPLSTIYLFDGVERDGVVEFKKRNVTTDVVTINYFDMGAHESTAPDDPFTVTRKHERELPASMWIEYQDKDKEYQIGGMAAYRVNTISKDEMKMTVPMVMTDAVAKQVAELRLFELWAARSTLETALSFRFARLTPGDPIELVFADGRKQLMLIVKTSLGNPGIVKITAVSVGPTTYTYAGGTVKVTV